MPNARLVSFPGLNHSQTSQASHLVVPHVTQFLHEVMQDERPGPIRHPIYTVRRDSQTLPTGYGR